MGGETAWAPLFEGGPVVGQGLKMFALGDKAYTIMEINSLTIEGQNTPDDSASPSSSNGDGSDVD